MEQPSTPPRNADRDQFECDWRQFSRLFEAEHHVPADYYNPKHKELFLWFTRGAHEEFVGRLTIE